MDQETEAILCIRCRTPYRKRQPEPMRLLGIPMSKHPLVCSTCEIALRRINRCMQANPPILSIANMHLRGTHIWPTSSSTEQR